MGNQWLSKCCRTATPISLIQQSRWWWEDGHWNPTTSGGHTRSLRDFLNDRQWVLSLTQHQEHYMVKAGDYPTPTRKFQGNGVLLLRPQVLDTQHKKSFSIAVEACLNSKASLCSGVVPMSKAAPWFCLLLYPFVLIHPSVLVSCFRVSDSWLLGVTVGHSQPWQLKLGQFPLPPCF